MMTTEKEKKLAHDKVEYAVNSGKLKRPDECEICGFRPPQYWAGKDPWTGEWSINKLDSAVIIAHHDDYSKPLKVRWLCRKCHCNIHKEMAEN